MLLAGSTGLHCEPKIEVTIAKYVNRTLAELSLLICMSRAHLPCSSHPRSQKICLLCPCQAAYSVSASNSP